MTVPLHLSQTCLQYLDQKDAMRLSTARNTFGSFLPNTLEMERSIVSKIQRIPPLKSSNLSFELLTGEAYDLDVHHVFDFDSEFSIDGHRAMEKKLKMK